MNLLYWIISLSKLVFPDIPNSFWGQGPQGVQESVNLFVRITLTNLYGI